MQATTKRNESIADLMAQFDAQQAAKVARSQPRHAAFRSAQRRELTAAKASGLVKLAIGAALAGLVVALVVAL